MPADLTPAQIRVLGLIGDRMVAVVWHDRREYPGRGLKPWYALTGGVLPTQLHRLWLAGLIRADRTTSSIPSGALRVQRACLTPAGRRALWAATTEQGADHER